MATFVALLDACVLYPAPLRDLLMHLAQTELFRARWTDAIHDEWIGALRANRPDLTAEQLARTRALMDAAVPDCLVTGYEGFIDSLTLPDPGDRHVLAAAIRCQAGVIVTANVKHFPEATLAPHGVAVQHPDDFVSHLFDLDAVAVATAVKAMRSALKNPPQSADQLFDTLLRNQLPQTVACLKAVRDLL